MTFATAAAAAPMIWRYAAPHPSLFRCCISLFRCCSFSTASGGGRRAGVPWLLLSSPDNPDSRYLYKLTKDETHEGHNLELHSVLSLPEIAGCDFIGSSHGFLLTKPTRKCTTIQAINPLTGDQLRLPPCDPLLSQEMVSSDERINRVFSETKAILSPSCDTVFFLFTFRRFRANFARLDASSSSWTPLPIRFINDFIFHKGRLHAVNWKGDLVVSDDKDLSSVSEVCFSSLDLDVYWEKKRSIRSYLVESPNGDDLFLLVREWPYSAPWSQTRSFQVFKLDDDGCKWKEVDDIGDHAMFVGPNSAVSLSAGDFPVLKSNAIYFTDDVPGRRVSKEYCDWADTGVYCLERKNFDFFELRDRQGKKLHYPSPVWLENIAEC